MGRTRGAMIVPTLIMGILAAGLVLFGYYQGDGRHIQGMRAAWTITLDTFPLLILAFIVAGMVQAFLSKEFVAEWIGTEAGWRGILLGTVAGSLCPGGPYISLPIAAGLYRAGAGVGTMVAFMSGWSLIAVNRLPMEIGMLGWRLTTIRILCTFFFAPISGFLAQFFFSKVDIMR